jgi:SAM-dependent methyltransferase
MYNNELNLFQKSANIIWTDDHISKSMLEFHLDETNDAASRMKEKRGKIINWINGKIKSNSNIIDLGCGPGLYSHELGKSGHKVLGVDFNQVSINYAQKNNLINGYVDFNYCNYLTDTINGKYNVAIMIYYDFGVLIPNEQKILLEKLKNILSDDGVFIFDIYGNNRLKKVNERRNWYISEGGDFWSEEPYLLMEETKLFEHENRWCDRQFLINQKNGNIKEFIVWEQYFDNDSINKLMSENGFEILEIDKDLLNDNEESLFVIAKKKNH